MALIRMEWKSETLMRGVTTTIILPDAMISGKETELPYRTLYFLPGYSASASELLTCLSFRRNAGEKEIAVVIPDGENSFYIDCPERNTCFSSFIPELVQQTRKLLPLSERREDTYLGGISMGGFGALYNGLRYRSVFSKIAAMSPVVDWRRVMKEEPMPGFSKEMFEAVFGGEERFCAIGADVKKEYAAVEWNEMPEVLLCCGRQDMPIFKDVDALHRMLDEKKRPHRFLSDEGEHSNEFWERMLEPVFCFLSQ